MNRPMDPNVQGERPCVCGAQVLHVSFRGVTYWRCENAATTCDAFGKTYEEALAYAKQRLETARRFEEVTDTVIENPEDCPMKTHAPDREFSELPRMMDTPIEDLATEEDRLLIKHLIKIGASELDRAETDTEAYAALGRLIKSAFLLGRWSARRLA